MVAGRRLTFDVAGLNKRVMTMRDRGTGTVWTQLDGRPVTEGVMDGERLTLVPVPMMTWGEWRARYPDTKVLDMDTPYRPGYRAVRIGFGRLASPDLVVGVEVNDTFHAYRLTALTDEGGVVNAEVGGEPVAVLYDVGSGTGAAFSRTVDGRLLTFAVEGGSGGLRLVDEETGSTWDVVGRAVGGPLEGESLTYVPSFISAWYGWVDYHPDTGLYPDDE